MNTEEHTAREDQHERGLVQQMMEALVHECQGESRYGEPEAAIAAAKAYLEAPPVPFCWHWRRVGTGSSGMYYEHPEKFGMSLTDPAYEWTVLYDKPHNTPPTEQPQEK